MVLRTARVAAQLFPAGTPVCVHQRVDRRGGPLEVETVGVVDGWEERPTGSWFAHGRDDKLWLTRVTLRKADGERVELVIDDLSTIARLEPASREKSP